MIKKCRKCNQEKPLSDYYNESNARCRSCLQEYARERYRNMPEDKKRDALERKRREYNRTKRRIYRYLELTSCVDCGESRVEVLDFDHVRGEKKFSISQAVGDKMPWTKIYEEMQKCEVRCANCHRVKTARENGWYSFLNEEPTD